MNREESDKLALELLNIYTAPIGHCDLDAMADLLWQAIQAVQVTPQQAALLKAVREWKTWRKNQEITGIYPATVNLLEAYEALEREEKEVKCQSTHTKSSSG